MIESRTTRQFRDRFASLPTQVRAEARAAYRLFLRDPGHPSLRFKKLGGAEAYPVRVGLHYRAVGALPGKRIVWFWIGSHAEFDRTF